jgi:uncharacterized protein (TIGR02217 family)
VSNAVFPTLAGITWPVVRAPVFSTLIQTATDLSELRATFMSEPVYDITLTYDILRSDSHAEFQSLSGFFESRQGSFDSFLFTDLNDSTANAQVFAVADGVSSNYQLLRTLGGANAIVKNLNGAPTITVNNVSNSSFTVSNTGVIQFSTPPVANAVLRWTGSYYLRARFSEDTTEFEQFMRLFWQVGQIKLRAALGTQL